MTREEAVIILDGFKNNPLFNSTHAQALDMAISALSAEPIRPKKITLIEVTEYCRDNNFTLVSNELFDEMININIIVDIMAEIKEWYWQADKQALSKDPCVVDAMVDLFIRTINKHLADMRGE